MSDLNCFHESKGLIIAPIDGIVGLAPSSVSWWSVQFQRYRIQFIHCPAVYLHIDRTDDILLCIWIRYHQIQGGLRRSPWSRKWVSEFWILNWVSPQFLLAIPKPYVFWSDADRKAIFPLMLMFSFGWSLEMLEHYLIFYPILRYLSIFV